MKHHTGSPKPVPLTTPAEQDIPDWHTIQNQLKMLFQEGIQKQFTIRSIGPHSRPYTLLITPDKLRLTFSEKGHPVVLELHSRTRQSLVNKKPQDDPMSSSWTEHLNAILADVRAGRAKIYEK